MFDSVCGRQRSPSVYSNMANRQHYKCCKCTTITANRGYGLSDRVLSVRGKCLEFKPVMPREKCLQHWISVSNIDIQLGCLDVAAWSLVKCCA